MKRNLKFWTRYTWESSGVVLVTAAVLAVISLFGAEGLDFAVFAAIVPYYLCIAAVFIMMMLNSSSQTLYVPLLLSMGETRRNVLLGFHYYRVLIIAVTAALCALIWLLAPGEVSAIGLRSIPTILCVLLIASALGSIMGTVGGHGPHHPPLRRCGGHGGLCRRNGRLRRGADNKNCFLSGDAALVADGGSAGVSGAGRWVPVADPAAAGSKAVGRKKS